MAEFGDGEEDEPLAVLIGKDKRHHHDAQTQPFITELSGT